MDFGTKRCCQSGGEPIKIQGKYASCVAGASSGEWDIKEGKVNIGTQANDTPLGRKNGLEKEFPDKKGFDISKLIKPVSTAKNHLNTHAISS